MVSIRKYEEKDRADMHFVCDNSEGPEEVPNYLTGLFYHNTFCRVCKVTADIFLASISLYTIFFCFF